MDWKFDFSKRHFLLLATGHAISYNSCDRSKSNGLFCFTIRFMVG